jgi:chorismate mutase
VGQPRLQALRGAITCDADTADEINEKTQRLVKELLARNDLTNDDLVSVVFTATSDLTTGFPAAAARAAGLDDVPLLCAQEHEVAGGMPRVVRVLVHCYTDKARPELRHAYLDGARALRTDLPE